MQNNIGTRSEEKDMEKSFWNAIKERRTYYSIGKEKIVSEKKLKELISDAIKYAPSAFNSQSARVVLLLNEQHDKIWEIVKSELKKIMPEENFIASEEKINNCFQSGYGTILYFEDKNSVEELQARFPLYKDNFPIWSNQSSGMLQYIIWSALESEGLGASLQHYNPLIDESIKKEWDLPENYTLIAQMPFGNPLSAPDDKDFLPIEDRFKTFD